MEERQKLLTAQSKPLNYDGSFSELENGKQWYQHMLASWLLDRVTTGELIEMARNELKFASTQYRSGDTGKNAKPPESHLVKSRLLKSHALESYKKRQHRQIVSAFRQRESTVNQELARLFNITQKIPSVKIEAANLPESFPAPGIYNSYTKTFLYHIQNGEIKGEHMDWLYVHEGNPGHHLQHTVSRNDPLCPTPSFMPSFQISSEGWAAYVETLGQELGLFSHPDSLKYAMQWRVLRALRVLIDIGLHHDGWSEEQAQALWMQYLPEEPEIMHREIARIKRWPVQVITYVYGKYLIEQTLQRGLSLFRPPPQQHPKLTAKLHNVVLRLSNQPPLALNFTERFLF